MFYTKLFDISVSVIYGPLSRRCYC